MTDRMIDNRIKKLRELEEQAAKIQEQVDVLKNELKAELAERKIESLETSTHRIFFSPYIKKVVDSEKLKKAGIYEKYVKLSTVRPFKITDINPV